MALHSFYQEAPPESPEPGDSTKDPRETGYLEQPIYRRSMGEPHINFFGTPVAHPRCIQAANNQLADLYSTQKPFEYELEKLQEEERSRRNSGHSSLTGGGPASPVQEPIAKDGDSTTLKKKSAPTDLPVELWDIIFDFVIPDLDDDDSYQNLGDLFNCALTCRHSIANNRGDIPQAWAYIALPVLYRTHGYGVFMPKLATRDSVPSRFPVSRSINFYTGTAEKRVHQLWRTLLLSCFTVSQPTSNSRFTTFTGATLFPYIKYVHNLDTRTLVMVLSEIMKARKRRSGDSDIDERMSGNTEAAHYFFAGALGAFEISGVTRGERVVVGGPEYESIQTPVWGTEIKLFVGDTALMMLDFLYPHLHHLRGFTIAELGRLRVSSPVTMAHPVSLLTSLTSLNSLVIPSGWMVSAGLGRAIASIRPTIVDRSSKFNLTILDWRLKTHYDPILHHNEDWEADHEDYRYTIRSAVDFFNSLNPNSITSLDLDFEVRYSRQLQGDLGDGAIAIRQSRSLEAFRIAHLRCDSPKLMRIFYRMGEAGFAPKALSLVELYKEPNHSHFSETGWGFKEGMFDQLEDLELVRFPDMLELAADAVLRPLGKRRTPPLRSLKLSYTRKHIEEARYISSPPFSFLHYIPQLADTLTTLKLCDTEHGFTTQTEPRLRASLSYDWGGNSALSSPLEALVNLRVLVLAGDISFFLIRNRLPEILHAIRKTLIICDLCFSITCLRTKLTAFLVCEKLTHFYLREWNWDVDEVLQSPNLLRTEDVEAFVERCKTVPVDGDPLRTKLVIRELGIDGGLLQVAARQNWGEVQKWVEERGCRFYWCPQQMWRVGYVAFNGRDPTFV